MTTTKSSSSSNGYPFATKSEIVARLEAGDVSFVHEALLILDGRQTDDERVELDSKWRNRRGWMSSHAVWGTRLASKVALGEPLTAEEEGKARGMVCRYGRQLAQHARAKQLRESPELAAQAARFGVGTI